MVISYEIYETGLWRISYISHETRKRLLEKKMTPNHARVVILLYDTLSCPVLYLYEVSSKYSKGYLTYRVDTKSMHNHCQILQREITKKITAELSFLYATGRLILFYNSTKCHQNIPKGSCITEQTITFTLTLMPTGSIPKTIRLPSLEVCVCVWGGGGGGVVDMITTSVRLCLSYNHFRLDIICL